MAATTGNIDLEIGKLPREHTLKVTVHFTNGFYIRLRIAKVLFWLGAVVLGCSVDIDTKELGE